MVTRRALSGLAILAACSGKPHTEEVAHGLSGPGDAAAHDAAAGAAAPGATPAPGATGELQVRVAWPDVPVAARSSPGRTPCGTPRAPPVQPTTTWGVPDALVVVDGAPRPDAPPVARVTLADCALTPRASVGETLAITSAVDRPARLVLRKRGALDHLTTGAPVPVLLPIAGHTVTVALDAGAVYSLETEAPDPEMAFVAATPNGRITDAAGHALVRDLAPGVHAVTAWLGPRAGQPARVGRGTATVTAGELTELTVMLAP